MFLRYRCLVLAALLFLSSAMVGGTVAAEAPVREYLLFNIFIGKPNPDTGVYERGVSKPEILATAQRIAAAVRPASGNPNRILGFAVGPIAMDQGADGARGVIRDAFDVALATDMAVAVHLDDYMFWKQAALADGRRLNSIPDTAERTDWSGTPAGPLDIGWLPDIKLAPQMCYENPQVRNFVSYWTRDVIGQEIKNQRDRLIAAGKGRLFAGVIVGWESNLSDGYCSLSYLGYGRQKPPADFDHERERVLQRHIELWAKGVNDAGIPSNQIFTHIAPMPKRDFARISAAMPRERIRQMPQSTAFGAYWVAFNSYSNPGFSAYVDDERFEQIYAALRAHGSAHWGMAEGTNAVLGPDNPGGVGQSPLDWETYLGRSFNHGATLVSIFAGFQGPPDAPLRRVTESEEAMAAYRKFLRGDALVESIKR